MPGGELGKLTEEISKLIEESKERRKQIEELDEFVKNENGRLTKLEEDNKVNKKFGKETRSNDNRKEIEAIALTAIIKGYPNIYGEKTREVDGKKVKYLPKEKNIDLYTHIYMHLVDKALRLQKDGVWIKSVKRFPQAPGNLYPAPIRVTFVRSIDKNLFFQKLPNLKDGPEEFRKIRVCPDRPALLNEECDLVDRAAAIYRKEHPTHTTKYIFVGEKPRIQFRIKNDEDSTWTMLPSADQKKLIEQVLREQDDDDEWTGYGAGPGARGPRDRPGQSKRKATSPPHGSNVNTDRRRPGNQNQRQHSYWGTSGLY